MGENAYPHFDNWKLKKLRGERKKNEENNTRNCKSAVKKCHNASLKDNNGKNSGVISDCKKNILIVAVCV